MMQFWGSSTERRGSIPGAVAGADAEVRVGATPGENTTDRVWAIRGEPSGTAGREKTRDLRFSGIHAHLRENLEGQLVYSKAADGEKAAAEQTASNTAGTA